MPYADPEQRKLYQSLYYQENKQRAKQTNRENWLRRVYENPAYDLIRGAKQRAKKVGLAFDLSVDDLIIPETCPYLGIPIIKSAERHSDNSPSLDRINPRLGYIKHNVEVISFRANRIKNDGLAHEHRLIADRLDILHKTANLLN